MSLSEPFDMFTRDAGDRCNVGGTATASVLHMCFPPEM